MNTTIALTKENYQRLLKIKHKLEEKDGIHSFNKTIEHLLDLGEKQWQVKN